MATKTFILRHGDTGAVLAVTLKDRNGAKDLSGGTCAVTLINRKTRAKVFDKEACVVDSDQVLNKGRVEHAFTTSDFTAIPNADAEYEAIFYFTDSLSKRTSFPLSLKDPPFLIVRVEKDDG